ncbi:unnamed protein product [Moneuplotes crassus]|uniref:TFIID subunit TAF5 NTD2 domain-containing protein n=1 Tax=Euplotes crassus TaxID=5936 RepID=A0AAD1U1E4_EUPCR|nr:unnamed protein product [Moneuplotes crassus]
MSDPKAPTPTPEPAKMDISASMKIPGIPHEIRQYKLFWECCDHTLDMYKEEMKSLAWPIFKNMYLDMLQMSKFVEAENFFDEFKDKFKANQEYLDIIEELETIPERRNLDNKYYSKFLDKKDRVSTSRECIYILVHYCQVKKLQTVLNVISNNLEFSKMVTRGISNSNNKVVRYLLDSGVDIEGTINKKSLKLKSLKLSSGTRRHHYKKEDYMDISVADIPIPNKIDYTMFLLGELEKSVEDLKTVCVHTVTHSTNQLICSDVSYVGDIVASGFSNGLVKIFKYSCTVVESKEAEKDKKNNEDNREDEDMNPEDKKKEEIHRKEIKNKTKDHKIEEIDCVGHKGPIYSVSISYDNELLISASHDATIRLWSIPMEKQSNEITSLVVYKGHIRPIWDIQFCPFGYFFASGSADTTALLWCTSSITPLRLFRGHFSDVEAVTFHPNIHYVATASNDNTIRMWEVEKGDCVRIFITGDSPTRCLRFTNVGGKYLLSTNDNGELIIFNVNEARVFAMKSINEENNTNEENEEEKVASNALWAVDISYDDKWIAVGAEDSSIIMYSWEEICGGKMKLLEESDHEEDTIIMDLKDTPVVTLRFTYRNLLNAVAYMK